MKTKPPAKSVQVSFRASPPLLDRIARAAAADRRSVSSWLRVVVERALAGK